MSSNTLEQKRITITQKQVNQNIKLQEQLGLSIVQHDKEVEKFEAKRLKYKELAQAKRHVLALEREIELLEAKENEAVQDVSVKEKTEIARTYDSTTGRFRDISVPAKPKQKKNPNRKSLKDGIWQ